MSKGTYCLVVKVKKNRLIRVGALGEQVFHKGLYVYVGSALNGLEARVNRHMRNSRGDTRRIHWHIDYLLMDAHVKVSSVYFKEGITREECNIADFVAGRGMPVKGFGSSDCRCVTHLYRVEDVKFLEGAGMHLWVADF